MRSADVVAWRWTMRRLKVRAEQSTPLFAAFRTWLDATLSRVSYVSRVSRLTLPAPEIVGAALDGRFPA